MSIFVASNSVDFAVTNQQAYEDPGVINLYSKADYLQLPEQTIIRKLQPWLADMDMLDMGVGGGRTTVYLADKVKSYIGTDYSHGMIEACKKRFSGSIPPSSFQVSDARMMDGFKDDQYDFVFFSFNSIDEIPEQERFTVFREVNRIGKSGGYFCFSTHNLQTIDNLFSLKKQWHRNPKTLIGNLLRWAVLRLAVYNPDQIKAFKQADNAIVNDGSHLFRFQAYYIKPEAQVEQLKPWFEDIEVYSLSTGQVLRTKAERMANTDPWLYYLCKIR